MTASLQRMQGEEERSYTGRGTDWSYPATDQDGTGKDKKGISPPGTGSTEPCWNLDFTFWNLHNCDRIQSCHHQKSSSVPKETRKRQQGKSPLGKEGDGGPISQRKKEKRKSQTGQERNNREIQLLGMKRRHQSSVCSWANQQPECQSGLYWFY